MSGRRHLRRGTQRRSSVCQRRMNGNGQGARRSASTVGWPHSRPSSRNGTALLFLHRWLIKEQAHLRGALAALAHVDRRHDIFATQGCRTVPQWQGVAVSRATTRLSCCCGRSPRPFFSLLSAVTIITIAVRKSETKTADDARLFPAGLVFGPSRQLVINWIEQLFRYRWRKEEALDGDSARACQHRVFLGKCYESLRHLSLCRLSSCSFV